MSFLVQERTLPRASLRPPEAAEHKVRSDAKSIEPLSDLFYPGEERLSTQLTLLPVSPKELLVTWSDPPPAGSPGNAQGGGNRQEVTRHLRVYDVTNVDFQGDNAAQQWDYELGNDQRECMIAVDRPGLVICAELIPNGGPRGSEAVARSRRVRLPGGEHPPAGGCTQWLIRDGGPM